MLIYAHNSIKQALLNSHLEHLKTKFNLVSLSLFSPNIFRSSPSHIRAQWNKFLSIKMIKSIKYSLLHMNLTAIHNFNSYKTSHVSIFHSIHSRIQTLCITANSLSHSGSASTFLQNIYINLRRVNSTD